MFCSHKNSNLRRALRPALTAAPVFAIFLALFPVEPVAAGEPESALSAQQIVERANFVSYYQGKDGRSDVRMTIVDPQGRERIRELTILRRNEIEGEEAGKGSDQKYLVVFHRPADVRNTVFLVWKHAASADDRWLYLPALDLVKRIAAGDQRTSFVGSDAFYEDVSGRGLDEDKHQRLPDQDGLYVIENLPKDLGSVEFTSYKVWIDPDTFVPRKAEYLDRNGKVYRVVEALDVETFDGFPTVTRSRFTDRQRGSSTELTFSEIQYNLGIPDDIFAERYLRRPPRKWLK